MQFVVRGTKYEIDQDTLTFAEARAIERVVGLPFDKLDQSSLSATQAMVWVAMKRSEPTLKYSDLDDLTFGEFEIVPDAEPEQVEADPTADRAAATLIRKFDEAGLLDDQDAASTETPPAT